MFKNAGEEHGGSVYSRCPGTGCDIWDAAGGTHEYKVETGVCAGCRQCGGNPPMVSDEATGTGDESDKAGDAELTDDEIDDLIGDVEDIVKWENAGFATDWMHYDFDTWLLVREWRDAERDVTALQATRMQMFIKGFFKES